MAIRVELGAHSTPPGLDGPHRKDRRVVVDADADEAFVGGQVIDALWDRFADRIGREVVHVHQLGLALRLPLAYRRS